MRFLWSLFCLQLVRQDFPFATAVLRIRDGPVGKPAHGDGKPYHGDAEYGSKGHGHGYADKQVCQVGDGEHFHIPCSTQNTVYSQLKADEAEEPAHESEVSFCGGKGCFCALCA